LFGPLRASDRNKKFILCLTDAYTKYVELVALDNKEAATVSTAIFDKWFCRYGIPGEIITDGGKEFTAQLSKELFKRLGSLHTTTTPHHPQCNSQAEVANKTIAKYLSSFVDDSTLNWEDYLAPLMFSYNTSFHRSIKTTPFFITFGIEPRMPGFPQTDVRRKFYGETNTDDLLRRLQTAREVARFHNQEATDKAQFYHDRAAASHQFKIGQLVLLNETYFLHKNAKLAPKWTGPHRVTNLKNHNNVEILLCHNNKKLLVHSDRLKAYHSGSSTNSEFPDFDLTKKITPAPTEINEHTTTPPTTTATTTTIDELFSNDDEYRFRQLPPRANPPPPPHFTPKSSPAQQLYETLPAQSERPSNILVRLGPPPPPIFSTTGGVQANLNPVTMKKVFVAVEDLPDNDHNDNEDDDDWILVTKKRKWRPKSGTWSQQQLHNFLQTGDIIASPDTFEASQVWDGDEDGPNQIAQQVQPQVPGQPQQQQAQQGQAPQIPGQPPNPPLPPRRPRPTPRRSPKDQAGNLSQEQAVAVDPTKSGSPYRGARPDRTNVPVYFARPVRPGSPYLLAHDREAPSNPDESQILFRLSSTPVPKPRTGVVPGLSTSLPVSPIPVPAQPEREEPTRASGSDQPTSDPDLPDIRSGSPVPSTSGEYNPFSELRRPAGTSPADLIRRPTGARPKAHRTNPPPPAPEFSSASSSPSSSSESESSSGASRADQDPQQLASSQTGTPGSGTPARSILKGPSSSSKAPRKVQFSPSTKRPKKPELPPRDQIPPAPDFGVHIRPTDNLDILDEVVAGQPSVYQAGQVTPDTLLQVGKTSPGTKKKPILQVGKPVPGVKKREKRPVSPSDRVLRPKSKPTSKK